MYLTEVMKEKIFSEFTQKYPHYELTIQSLEENLQKQSKKLICRNGRVRRAQPFDNKISTQESQLIFIEGIPDEISNEQVRQVLED